MGDRGEEIFLGVHFPPLLPAQPPPPPPPGLLGGSCNEFALRRRACAPGGPRCNVPQGDAVVDGEISAERPTSRADCDRSFIGSMYCGAEAEKGRVGVDEEGKCLIRDDAVVSWPLETLMFLPSTAEAWPRGDDIDEDEDDDKDVACMKGDKGG